MKAVNGSQMVNKKERIKSLQGLRTLAFYGVFSSHSGGVALGCWGVACFLVMSGFLMYYNYCDRNVEISLKDNWNFAKKRIKPLYALHLITLVIAIVVYGINIDSLRHGIIYVAKVIFNALLLQSWVPKSEFYYSFNAVSWYLSTSLALYFIFPCLLKRIQKMNSVKKASVEIAFTVAAQVVVALILNYYRDFMHAIPMKISDDLIGYLAFICPLYRVGDFYVGCLLGYLFKNKVFSHVLDNVVISTFLEIIALVAAPLLLKVCQKQIGLLGTESFRQTLIYLGEVMILVYTVAYSRGLISRWIFSSKWMVAIGNISGYAFLIHWSVLIILSKGLNISKEMFIIGHAGGLVITLVASFAISYIVKLGRGSMNEWRFGRKK